MLFNTFQFALFFCLVLLLHRRLPAAWRNPLLLGASLVFYTLWVPAYLILFLVDIGVNYALIQGMVRSRHPRIWLACAVTFTLGLLAYFKYAALLIETALPALEAGFAFIPPVPEIFLPLGISFYSFQIIALSVDVYRGTGERPKSLARYALFVSFFPQLIAGPILRGHDLLPQLERGARPNRERSRRGLSLIASGLVKKVFLADFLLSNFVDDLYGSPGVASAPFHLVAMYSFVLQIYFDFSGYSDIARGLANLLGFELPLNFVEPFVSRNPTELWERWHITLSHWLRDYLYIPLGGSRVAPVRVYVNLMLTMVLGGFWHGAAWNFLIFGAIHGVGLSLHRMMRGRDLDFARPIALRDAPRMFGTFTLFAFSGVFFRSPTFDGATTFTASMITGGGWTVWPVMPTAVAVFCMALCVTERIVRLRLPEIRAALDRVWGPPLEASALGMVVGLAIAVSGAGGAFIYFQF